MNAYSRDFSFFTPVNFFEKADAPEGFRRRIGGLITTDAKDLEGETILQEGLDFDGFIAKGWLNDNHSKKQFDVLGYPETVHHIKKGEQLPDGRIAGSNGHWMEGYLLEGYEPADKIWALGRALQKTQGRRRLGFSIEGAIQKRTGSDRKIIAKARVDHAAITHCFTGDMLVSGDIERVTRRLYSGAMIELRLSTGEKLTGTPNHPIFTNHGWKPLGSLREGYDLIGRSRNDISTSSVRAHNKQYAPATFQEIFDLAEFSSIQTYPRTYAEFHGDWGTSDVDIVLTDGLLEHRLRAAFYEQFGQVAHLSADFDLPAFFRLGVISQFLHRLSRSATSYVRSYGELLALFGRTLRASTELLVATTSGDAVSFSDVVNGNSRESEAARKLGCTETRGISFSDISFKRTYGFSGHVYNLQTQQNWYSANGVVVHNCPVNPETGLSILTKSLRAAQDECEHDALKESCKKCMDKALMAGSASGAALMPESLETKKRRELNKSECVAWIHERFPKLDMASVGRMVDLTFALKTRGLI